MNQKFVVKKCSPKQSVIRLPSRWPSGVARQRTSSSRSRSENPIERESTIFPSPSTSRAMSSQANSSCPARISWVTDTEGSSSVGMPASRSYVQRNSASNIRPPRMV